MRRRKAWLVALLLLALLLAAPLLVNLEVFREPVRRAVERQLGRPVEFARLGAQFLPWPGLVGRGVVVYEQEGFGAEPFLYADEVHCHVSLGALRSGRLEFSEIYFIQPSINLVRAPAGAWNVGAFLLAGKSGAKAGHPAPARPPVISATEGRINLKLGADKQVYALTGARLRAEPLPAGRWRLQLEATPWRSDRRLTETGSVKLQGEVGQSAALSSVPFRFQVGLERGSLSQLIALVVGNESWVRARSGLAATVEGTPADWRAQGTLTITGLRHKDLVAPSRTPRWQADFGVGFQEEGQVLRIDTLRLRARQSRLELTGRVDDLLRAPGWDLQLRADPLAADELMAQWAALKSGASTEARLDGSLQLALTARGPLREWKGQVEAADTLTLRAPALPQPAELLGLRMVLRRGRMELAPLTLRFSPESALRVEGDWRFVNPGSPYRLRWQSPGWGLSLCKERRRFSAAISWLQRAGAGGPSSTSTGKGAGQNRRRSVGRAAPSCAASSSTRRSSTGRWTSSKRGWNGKGPGCASTRWWCGWAKTRSREPWNGKAIPSAGARRSRPESCAWRLLTTCSTPRSGACWPGWWEASQRRRHAGTNWMQPVRFSSRSWPRDPFVCASSRRKDAGRRGGWN